MIALTALACGSSSEPPPAGSRIGPALLASIEAAERVRAPWRCGAPDGPKLVDERHTIGAHAWTFAEHTMRLDRAGGRALTIGVIADAGGATAPTMAALGRLRAKLAEADLVIALGGMGTTRAELEATLGALADRAAWPLVALPGDLEAQGELVAAVGALRARGLHVIDGRLARRIELPGVTLGLVAGAGADSRLVAGVEGCRYRGEDAAAVINALTPRPGLRILATAEAPRITTRGEPAGVRAITPGALQEVDVILHGPVVEAPTPARTGGRDGAAVALSPGTSDATLRLPGPRASTSAGLLAIRGTAWRWRPIADID